MVTLLEGVLAVYSQGVSSNVRGEHPPRLPSDENKELIF